MKTIDKEKAIQILNTTFPDLVTIKAWGETSLFYNPEKKFKRGKYFATFKEKDGENDKTSKIDREEVSYRLNFKIKKETFLNLFQLEKLPSRPAKSHAIYLAEKNYDPTATNKLMPHPVYGWMSWVCILNPTEESFSHIMKEGLFQEAYANAIKLASDK